MRHLANLIVNIIVIGIIVLGIIAVLANVVYGLNGIAMTIQEILASPSGLAGLFIFFLVAAVFVLLLL